MTLTTSGRRLAEPTPSLLSEHIPGMPANVEAEKALIGSVFYNPACWDQIGDWFRGEFMYLPQHQPIVEAIQACHERQVPPEIHMVYEQLQRVGKAEFVGGLEYLASLGSGVSTAQYIAHFADLIRRKALRRLLILAGGQIASLGHDETIDDDQIFDRAEAALLEVVQRRTSARDFTWIGDLIPSYVDEVLALKNAGQKIIGVPTGLIDLDKITGGLQPSDFIILAARPSVGKSALAFTIAYNVASLFAGAVGVFSLEMSREQIVQRLFAMHTGIDTQRLRTGDLRSNEVPMFYEAADRLQQLPIYIEDSPGLSIAEVRSKARLLCSQVDDVKLIVVDYLQLMAGRRAESRAQEVSEISRGLKNLARELNVPVLALSQLSRAVESRTSHVPMLSDLRESGSLEQDADVVMFIYREELYDPQTSRPGVAEIHLAKHRNGPVGVIPTLYHSQTTRFMNLATIEQSR